MFLFHTKKLIILILISWVLFGQIDLEDAIPFDNSVRAGMLDNGFTYYIKHNTKPENRAELRLAVDIGSVDEDDDQQGIAHLVEHMCFNGTEKYPKNDLVDYLESIGMAFGPDLNAYTAFDRTVYMLQIPTDDSIKFTSGIEILSEWAGYVSFDDEEIDKERGVVIEEWRLRQGASARVFNEQFPVLFDGSKYANRLPIGKIDIIENISHKRVRDFYNTWYRPDLMSFIAVGDFDVDQVEEYIHTYFGRISNENEIEPQMYDVPSHDETRVVISSDPEARLTSATITYKHDISNMKTMLDYRQSLIQHLYFDMLNQRFDEIIHQNDAPFVQAYSWMGSFVQTKEMTTVGVYTANNKLERGLTSALSEVERLKQHGFVQQELNRAIDRTLSSYEKQFNERDKTESKRLVNGLIDYFLDDEPSPGIEWEYNTSLDLLQTIQLNELNELSDEYFKDISKVIQVSSPEGEEIRVPSENEILDIVKQTSETVMEPYVDDTLDKPLIANIAKRGTITSESSNEDLGMVTFTLSNGIELNVKSTNFKNDEILINMFAEGGNSLTPKTYYQSGMFASDIVNYSGVGGFTSTQLEKLLAGKEVSVSSYIQQYFHGINASSTPKDLEIAFQLMYLYFTQPNNDYEQFQSMVNRYRGFFENRKNDPESQWRDLVDKINYSNHYAKQPLTAELLDVISHKKAFEIYEQLFGNPSNFKVVIVGNVNIEKLKEYAEKYLGSITQQHSDINKIKDINFTFPFFPKNENIYMGSEEKSKTKITFYKAGKFDFDTQYQIQAMTEILKVRLRKLLREDMSATYGVSVWPYSLSPGDEYATITISFGSSPDNVDAMTDAIFAAIKTFKKEGPTQEEVQNIIEKDLNQREINLETNKYWLRSIVSCIKHDLHPNDILTRNDRIKSNTPKIARKLAKKHFSKYRYSKITLYPENGE